MKHLNEENNFSQNEFKQLFKKMLTARMFEDSCYDLYSQGKIRGFMHLSSGQEAIAVGVILQLKKTDHVFSSFRDHIHALMKGIPLKQIMAELFGKQTGCSKGYGGSMHLFSKEYRFYGGNAIVGAHIPHAVGMALAEKRKKTNHHTVCFFGDGAAAEGVFYESLNIASLWDIPILFCCENNLYAMGTSLKKSHANTNLCAKGKIHYIESQQVDGMKIIDVINQTQNALNYIKENKKPFLLEFLTYRFRAHSMFDPELYRTKEELNLWKLKDPLKIFSSYLLSQNIMSDAELKFFETSLIDEIKKEISEAIEFAENSPFESPEVFLNAWESK